MIRRSLLISVLSFIATGVMLGACTKTGGGSNEEPRPSAPATAPGTAPATPPSAAAPETLSAEGRQTITHALDAYEQIRAQLAADDVAGVTASADTLEKAAGEATSKVPERLRTHLQAVASSARSLKEMSKEDASAVRRTFGDVSRSVVALLAAGPSLQQGRHVFECPMAQGYKKWVQPTAELSNPYMGTRMPSCGSASEFTAGG